MHYDVIVIGVGGIGSGTLYHLAKRGLRALGLDRFGIAHDRGSSHGRSRIIRKAYFEHPDYVPLCERAFDEWTALEAETGTSLYEETGLLLVGPTDGEAIAGAGLSAERYGVPIENLDATTARDRFPQFSFPDDADFVFEPRAGFLRVEACVRAHVEAARARGAELREEAVVAIEPDGTGYRVRTERDTYRAATIVDCRGPFHELPAGFRVLRKVQLWFPAAAATFDSLPVFYFETPMGAFYGLPRRDGATIKVAEHTGEDLVQNPTELDRSLRESDIEPSARFVESHLPGVEPRPVEHAVCMYTMSPDGHFVVGPASDRPNTFVAMGLSGHGFKFTGVLGRALADLVVVGRTDIPIGFLSPKRFDTAG